MLTDIFLPEIMGTAILILLGTGVVANAALPRTGGNGADILLINFGWGLGVYAGVYVAYKSGGPSQPRRDARTVGYRPVRAVLH